MKGSDTSVFSKLDNYQEQPFKQSLDLEMKRFGNAGLRTMSFAMRVIEEEEYRSFLQRSS